MKRRPIFFSVVLTAAVLILGWLVVRSVPSAERARLEAAYRADVERWGDPDDWEWVRPPVFGPAVEGVAADWYGKARAWLESDRGSVHSGLLSGHEREALWMMLLRWATGQEPGHLGELVQRHRPALDLIARGARAARSGTARDLRTLALPRRSDGDWIRDLILIGSGDAILLVNDGDPRAAVDRALAMLRFAEDFARCGVSHDRSRAPRAVELLAKWSLVNAAEEQRIARYLTNSLLDSLDRDEVVERSRLLADREYLRLLHARASGTGPTGTGFYRDDRVVGAVDDAIGLGLLPTEILASWRRTRRAFGRLGRMASRGEDAGLIRAAHHLGLWSHDDERGIVERSTAWWTISRCFDRVESAYECRIEMEAILYGIRLRQIWRRTGRRPATLDGVLPPGVRERPGGYPWLLRPKEHGLDLVWSGDRSEYPISFYIHPPADLR